MLAILLILLAIGAAVYAVVLVQSAIAQGALKPSWEATFVGGVINFFDTLGIGSFAPPLAWIKLRTRLPARMIPSTMIVANTPPTMMQAAIFLVLLGVHVDTILLCGYSVALLAGGLVGARLVTFVRVWIVQVVVAAALLVAAGLYALSNLHLMPAGGVAATLPVPLMLVAIAVSFVMGVLLNFGVGHYAPSLLMLCLMGMDPRLVFPIMAGGGAVASAVISTRHITVKVADLRIAIGFALGGIPGVLIAAFLIKDMSVVLLRWLVILVVLYAAAVMLREVVAALRRGAPDGDDLALAEGLAD